MTDPAELSLDHTPARVVVVRHGATEWSDSSRHTGRTDIALSAAGRDEAAALRTLLRQVVPRGDVFVFSSPLRRALDTCTIALGDDVHPTVVDSLAEWDYGSYEGLTALELRERQPGWELFRDGTPDGETLAQVTARCQSFIAKLERTAAGGVVVVFTHGHTGRVLTALLVGWPASAAAQLHNDTGSVGIVDLRRGRYVLSGWNRRPPGH